MYICIFCTVTDLQIAVKLRDRRQWSVLLLRCSQTEVGGEHQAATSVTLGRWPSCSECVNYPSKQTSNQITPQKPHSFNFTSTYNVTTWYGASHIHVLNVMPCKAQHCGRIVLLAVEALWLFSTTRWRNCVNMLVGFTAGVLSYSFVI